ncbi:MAG: hypothetical protein ACKKL5_03505 [Candidatus Komeilibacteria bacterium]
MSKNFKRDDMGNWSGDLTVKKKVMSMRVIFFGLVYGFSATFYGAIVLYRVVINEAPRGDFVLAGITMLMGLSVLVWSIFQTFKSYFSSKVDLYQRITWK